MVLKWHALINYNSPKHFGRLGIHFCFPFHFHCNAMPGVISNVQSVIPVVYLDIQYYYQDNHVIRIDICKSVRWTWTKCHSLCFCVSTIITLSGKPSQSEVAAQQLFDWASISFGFVVFDISDCSKNTSSSTPFDMYFGVHPENALTPRTFGAVG